MYWIDWKGKFLRAMLDFKNGPPDAEGGARMSPAVWRAEAFVYAWRRRFAERGKRL